MYHKSNEGEKAREDRDNESKPSPARTFLDEACKREVSDQAVRTELNPMHYTSRLTSDQRPDNGSSEPSNPSKQQRQTDLVLREEVVRHSWSV
jgi:hypothetical protein